MVDVDAKNDENGYEAEVLLLEHKTDVDTKAVSGKTALYLAAENGHEAVVLLLLKHMADADAKDNDDWTAIHWVADDGTRQRCG
jgi:ankyrin repeat protein